MDFFAQQDLARRSTRRLVILFALSVVVLITALNVVVYHATSYDRDLMANRAALHLGVSIIVLSAIAIGSAVKTAQLSAGGAVVAEMMGARPLNDRAAQPAERVLLNVVEEMS
ncbi:MAG: peptidase M48 Ste24p, partial [Planctomycetes bacterium]|nr:peptidase M48 Ste24p [Planctomycetota bacterium]